MPKRSSIQRRILDSDEDDATIDEFESKSIDSSLFSSDDDCIADDDEPTSELTLAQQLSVDGNVYREFALRDSYSQSADSVDFQVCTHIRRTSNAASLLTFSTC